MKKHIKYLLASLPVVLGLASCQTETVTGDVFECELEINETFYNNTEFSFKIRTNRNNILITALDLDLNVKDIESYYPEGFSLNTELAVQSGVYTFTNNRSRLFIQTPYTGSLSVTVKDPVTKEEKTFNRSFDLSRGNTVSAEIVQSSRNQTTEPFNGYTIAEINDIDTDRIIYGDEPFLIRFETGIDELVLEDVDFEFDNHKYAIGSKFRPVKDVFTWDFSDHVPVTEDWLRTDKPRTARFTFSDPKTGETGIVASCDYYTLRKFDAAVSVRNSEILNGDNLYLHIDLPARENFTLSKIYVTGNSDLNANFENLLFAEAGNTPSSNQRFTLKDGAIDLVSAEPMTFSTDYKDVVLTIVLKDSDYTNIEYEYSVVCNAYKNKVIPISRIIWTERDASEDFFRINRGETRTFSLRVLPAERTEPFDVFINGTKLISQETPTGAYSENINQISCAKNGNDNTSYTLAVTGGKTGGDVNIRIVPKSGTAAASCEINGYVRHRVGIAIEMLAGKDVKDDGHDYASFYNFPTLFYCRLVTWDKEPSSSDKNVNNFKNVENLDYGEIKASVIINGKTRDPYSWSYFYGWRTETNSDVTNGYLPSKVTSKTNPDNQTTNEKWFTDIDVLYSQYGSFFQGMEAVTDNIYFVSSKTDPQYPANEEEYTTKIQPYKTGTSRDAERIKEATKTLDYRVSLKNTLLILQNCNSDARLWAASRNNRSRWHYNKWDKFYVLVKVNKNDYNSDILDLKYIIHDYRIGVKLDGNDNDAMFEYYNDMEEEKSPAKKYWWQPFESIHNHFKILEDPFTGEPIN